MTCHCASIMSERDSTHNHAARSVNAIRYSYMLALLIADCRQSKATGLPLQLAECLLQEKPSNRLKKRYSQQQCVRSHWQVRWLPSRPGAKMSCCWTARVQRPASLHRQNWPRACGSILASCTSISSGASLFSLTSLNGLQVLL